MKIHFLGTTGYHPNDQRQTACLMIPEVGVILDAGTGLFRARDLIETETLHIFLTHVHLDHSIGLTFLFDVLHEKDVKVFVYAEEQKIAALREHLFSDLLFPAMPPFEFVTMNSPHRLPAGNEPENGTLTTFQLEHPGGSLGFRLDWPDRSLAYVTDTTAGKDSNYIKHINNVDLLVHECYFPDGWEERAKMIGHSCLGGATDVAKAAGAKRLALVHINPLDPDGNSLNVDRVSGFDEVFIPDDQQIVEF